MTINIVGAGLGGLLLAQGLIRRGIACRVFERDRDPGGRSQGYRISLNPLGRAALEALLLPERFARVLELECRDVGRGFCFARTPERALVRFDADAWTVCRPLLRERLLEGVPVEWGAHIERLSDLPRADLTVAADGIHSRLREELGPRTPRLVDTGVRTIAGFVPRTADWDRRLPLNREGAVHYLGPRGQALFVSHCERDDRAPMTLWALSQRSAEAPQIDPRWHPTLRGLLHASERTVERLSLSTTRLPRLRGRLHPRLTLLGDAAHAMPPQRGLGGNHAFEDARRLCDSLDDIAAYEREMFSRAQRALADSEEALQLLHFSNPIARGLRNTALRIAAMF